MGLKDLMVRIRADNSELDKAVIESSRRMEQVGKRLDRMGRSLSLNVTAPLVALGAGAVASSIKFEDAMAGVAKTVDASAQTITALGDEFKTLSEQIPVAATELANIGEAAGQLGIETSNILGFTRVMADLGVATNLTSTEAATDLARLANITQMPQDQFDRLGSTVVALGNKLPATEREIVSMGLRLAGAGVQVGLTEDQILALAASLSSVGIEAESGGTALSKVMAEMAIAVADGGDKLEQFAQVAGMSGAEFAKSFEEDATDAIVSFVEGLGRLKDEGVNVFQVLESVEFGNIRVRDALLLTSAAGELMRSSLDLGSTAWRENTALTIEAEQFYATTGNQLKALANKIVNIAGELGDQLKPALLAIADAAKPVLEFLRGMINWFGELPKSIQTTAIAMVALTVVLGPALVAISRITIALGMLRGAAALGGLGSLLLPGGAILVGLITVTSLFLGLKKSIDDTAASQRSFTAATGDLTKAEAIEREAEARRKLADAEREHDRIGSSGSSRSRNQRLAEIRELHNEVRQAADDAQRLTDALNNSQSPSGAPTVSTFDEQEALLAKQASLDKQAALAKRLQDEMVAATKTAVDDMQLDYDRLEAHIIEVDGAISASWQKMLDGRQADIAAVSLAEQFPELAVVDSLDAALAKADQREAALGRGFDLVSAKVDIFRSALEEMIDLGLGPTNEKFQEVLDKLRRFTVLQEEATAAAGEFGEKGTSFGEKGTSFFGDLKDQAKGLLDPQAIVSTALGTLLSGGISTALSGVVSGIGSVIGGLFGPSDKEIAAQAAAEAAAQAAAEAMRINTATIQKNIEAADRLGDDLNALSDVSVTLPLDAALQALNAIAEARARHAELIMNPPPSDDGVADEDEDMDDLDVFGPGGLPEFFPETILAKFGLTLDDIEEIAKALKQDFQSLSRDSGTLITALGNVNTFNRDFGLLQKQFALFDIEGPGEQFASVMDLLAAQVSDGFATVLEGLTPENFDAFLEDMFADGFAGFDKSLLGDDLTFDQFLTAIGFAESALDGLATEVERSTAALRNAPAGFKVAAARFTATTALDPTVVTDRDGGGRPLQPRIASDAGDFTRPRITVEGDIVLQGVQNPRELMDRLEPEVEWRARTGASTIATTTRTARRI